MGIGIIVCGLNGSGKSTFGKALAEKLKFHFIDSENLFFPKTDASYRSANARSRAEAERCFIGEIRKYENFVFAAVKGDYAKEIYQYAVLLNVPKSIRLERLRNRTFLRFGDRMLPGGDLYEQEKAFFDMASARKEDYVEEWAQSLKCPVIRVDGRKPIEENLAFVIGKIHEYSSIDSV